jgi:hypothetical protein
MRRLGQLVLAFALPSGAAAQASPRAANPERPTVATHAYAVAPGFAELEQGVRTVAAGPSTLLWEFNLKLGLAREAQLGLFGTGLVRTHATSGVGDLGVALKARRDVGERAALALVGAATFPTGNATLGFGAGETRGSLIAVVSADLPLHFHVDLNAGPTAIGAGTPQVLTTLSLGRSAGRVTFAGELYQFTAGGAGPRQAALLGAVALRVVEWAVLDGGAVRGLAAGTADQAFLGATVNLGRIFK